MRLISRPHATPAYPRTSFVRCRPPTPQCQQQIELREAIGKGEKEIEDRFARFGVMSVSSIPQCGITVPAICLRALGRLWSDWFGLLLPVLVCASVLPRES